jgi:hypothetical protein
MFVTEPDKPTLSALRDEGWAIQTQILAHIRKSHNDKIVQEKLNNCVTAWINRVFIAIRPFALEPESALSISREELSVAIVGCRADGDMVFVEICKDYAIRAIERVVCLISSLIR